jgi:GT2 family glycosyltransferase
VKSRQVADFTVFSSQRDIALPRLRQQLANSEADVLYWDTRFVSLTSSKAFLRPTYSPVRLLSQQYIGTNFAVRTALVEASDLEGDGNQMLRRLSAEKRTFLHIPEIFNLKFQSAAKSVEASYLQDRAASRVDPISFVIPTAFAESEHDKVHLLECVESLLPLLSQDEVIIVSDEKFDAKAMQRVRDLLGNKLIHVRDSRPFNFSTRVNLGFAAAKNSYLALLNDDVRLLNGEVLDKMVSLLNLPDVGLVGTKLLYPKGKIQHAGHVHGEKPRIAYQRSLADADYFLDCTVDREVSGVTGAFTLQKTEVFAKLGGYSEDFPLSFNDVDYSLKTSAAGYSIVICNSDHAVHHESATRQKTTTPQAAELLANRWGNYAKQENFTRNKRA